MELVIKIPEEYYKAIKEIPVEQSSADMLIIRSGTPLPKGHWIDGVCSECGYIGDEEVFGGKFKYCPACGAVMRGEE